MSCLIGELFLNVAELGVVAKRGVRDLFHGLHIRNAKDACEDYIKKYIKCYDWHNENSLYSNITQYFNSCSSDDKEAILKNLQIKINGLDKEIQDIKDDKKTLKFHLFHQPTKEGLIKGIEYIRDRCKDVLNTLNQTKTLRPVT